MFGMKGFYIWASGEIQGHYGPLVNNLSDAHWDFMVDANIVTWIVCSRLSNICFDISVSVWRIVTMIWKWKDYLNTPPFFCQWKAHMFGQIIEFDWVKKKKWSPFWFSEVVGFIVLKNGCRLVQLESKCRWQFQCSSNGIIFLQQDGKHCGKRRKCWLPAFSPISAMFFEKASFPPSFKVHSLWLRVKLVGWLYWGLTPL